LTYLKLPGLHPKYEEFYKDFIDNFHFI